MKRLFPLLLAAFAWTVATAAPVFTTPVPKAYDVFVGDHSLVDLVVMNEYTALRLVNGAGEWVGTSTNGETFDMELRTGPDAFWFIFAGEGGDGTLSLTEHFSDDSFTATGYQWERRVTVEGELSNMPIFADLIRVADMRRVLHQHDTFYFSSHYPQLNLLHRNANAISFAIDAQYGLHSMHTAYVDYLEYAEEMRFPDETERSTIIVGAAERYISLLSVASVNTGGAHPNSYSETLLLYRADDGVEQFGLGDLFPIGSNWLAEIGQYIQQVLVEDGATWPGEEGATEPFSAHDLRNFMFTPDGMVFRFDPYEVGPYVEGAFTVTVPYSLVMEYAHDDSAVTKFAYSEPSTLLPF